MTLSLYHILAGKSGLASATMLGDFLWYFNQCPGILPRAAALVLRTASGNNI
jgi:hypothetical protein